MATLEELQARRARYVAAETKALESQEYAVGQGMNARRNRRADLEVIQAAIKDLDDEIQKLQAAGARRLYNLRPGCR